MGSETVSRNFSHTIALKSIGLLVLERDLLPMYDVVISYIGYLGNIILWIYTFGLLHYILFLKIAFVNISTDLFRKVFRDSEASRHMVADSVFPEF